MKRSFYTSLRKLLFGVLTLLSLALGQVEAARLVTYSRGSAENTNFFIICHGRGGSSGSDYIQTLAAAVHNRYQNYPILLFDWSELSAADLGWTGYGGEDNIPYAASLLSGYISTAGVPTGNINLIGHSWGALVCYETAKRLGGVHTIIAIDPAEDFPTGYNTSLADFGIYSDRAWSITTPNIASSSITPVTADESFVVLGSEHTQLVRDLAAMIASPLGATVLNFERLFSGFLLQTVIYNSFDYNGRIMNFGGYDLLLDRSNNTASAVLKPRLAVSVLSGDSIRIAFDARFRYKLSWSHDLQSWSLANFPPRTVSEGQSGVLSLQYELQLGSGPYQFRLEQQSW
jgi:pimeloyl-ACP methyl ester carboxylesterase